MKKLFLILGIVVFVLFSYFLTMQYKQYNAGKANLYFILINDSWLKDSVTFNIYLNDSLVVSHQRTAHQMIVPYFEKFGVKTGLGNQKITVVINDGFMQQDFEICVFLVRYCIISFSDKRNENATFSFGDEYNKDAWAFDGFKIEVNTYSVLFSLSSVE